jgi:hypothetical protein
MPFAPEQLVRPFQTRPFGPAIAGPGSGDGPPPPDAIVIKWEGKGGKVFDYVFNYSSTMQMPDEEEHRETKRISKKKRIENPEDSTQYVEFMRATEITTKRVGKPGGMRIKYQWPD